MFTKILMATLTSISFTAFAYEELPDPTPREICFAADLESLNTDTPTVRRTYRRDIQAMSDEQIDRLSTRIKQHIIIVAKDAYLQGYEPRNGWNGRWSDIRELSRTTEAVEYIRQINENPTEELLYTYFIAANGIRFNRVTYYPGAVVGRIYLKGTLTTVALINDMDVRCVD